MKRIETCSFHWYQKIVTLCVQVMLLSGTSAVFVQHRAIVRKAFKVPQWTCVLEPTTSDVRIRKMKKEARNEDDFYAVTDDVNYYLYQAREFMKRNEQKVTLVSTAYIGILFPKGGITQADTIASNSIILYKPGKNPQVVSSVDIAKAYKSHLVPAKRKRRR